MNIAQYISPSHAVPPDEESILAPWMLVRDLADALVQNGHTVHLFAARGSDTNAQLHDAGILPTIHEKDRFGSDDAYRSFVVEKEHQLLREAIDYCKDAQVDVLHIHQPIERLLPVLDQTDGDVPLVFTFHDPIASERFEGLQRMESVKNCHFVSISDAQRNQAPVDFVSTVYNGIDIQTYKPDDMDLVDRPLLMVGRIVPEKGFEFAIQAARKADVRLMIVGQRYDKNEQVRRYFDDVIKPQIDGDQVIWEPVVKRDHLIGHYQTARALFFPITWEEPFGLVMVEAMACGTPVIAYNHGSVPEVVKDGKTGFIVEDDEPRDSRFEIRDSKTPARNPNLEPRISNNWIIKKRGVEGLAEAVKRISEIDRSACRRHVNEHFSIDRMVDGYIDVYTKILQKIS